LAERAEIIVGMTAVVMPLAQVGEDQGVGRAVGGHLISHHPESRRVVRLGITELSRSLIDEVLITSLKLYEPMLDESPLGTP
jgi:hypothetical protein